MLDQSNQEIGLPRIRPAIELRAGDGVPASH
jgi:hypothetical protein